MNDDEKNLSDDWVLRSDARAVMVERFSALKNEFTAKGVRARVVEKAAIKAQAVGEEAKAVANEHRGVVAGTVGLLALWLMRKPLLSQAERVWPKVGPALRRVADRIEKDWTR